MGIIFCFLLGLFHWISIFSSVEATDSNGGITDSPKITWPDIEIWNDTIQFDEQFEIRQFRLTVQSLISQPVEYWWQYVECKECPLEKQALISEEGNFSYIITQIYGTAHTHHLSIAHTNGTQICRGQKQLLERGEYWLIVSSNNVSGIVCDLVLFNDPPNVNLPILWTFLGLVILALIWIFIKMVYRKGVFQKCNMKAESHDLVHATNSKLELTQNGSSLSVSENNNINLSREIIEGAKLKQRLQSLDTFRGLSLTIMIFVNYGGGQYYFFQHAAWNGLLVADMVFPWFMWIMGTSMVFSFKGLRKRQTPTTKIMWKIVKRSVLLFVIGILLQSEGADPNFLRIPGVLQYFSITYFVVAMTHLFLGNVTLDDKNKWWSPVRDITLYWGEWLVMLVILALHLGLLFGLAEPGCPSGYLGPGGMHKGGMYFNCTGGAAGYIDRTFFTEDHIFRWNAVKPLYHTTQNHDPEGILGSLTSIIMCFLGLQAGKIIAAYKGSSSRIFRWLIWAVILGAIGIILCQAKLSGGWIPINKNIWSVSFILILAAMAFLLLSVMYVAIDILEFWSGAPFFYPGMNSIVVYCCHSIFAQFFPVSWILSHPTVHWTHLLIDVWGTAIWIIMAYVMYSKNIFIAL